jgi:hypothetical protein
MSTRSAYIGAGWGCTPFFACMHTHTALCYQLGPRMGAIVETTVRTWPPKASGAVDSDTTGADENWEHRRA